MSARKIHLTLEAKREAQRASNRRYAARHREERAAYGREWRKQHPDKAYAQAKRWRAAHPEAVTRFYRRRRLRKEFGLTEAQYTAMAATQGGLCAICGQAPEYALEVDHDHATGQVRALLCRLCNRMLGLAKDDPARLASAIRYLAAHQ